MNTSLCHHLLAISTISGSIFCDRHIDRGEYPGAKHRGGHFFFSEAPQL